MSTPIENEVIPTAPAFCQRLSEEEMAAQTAKATEEALKALHAARASGVATRSKRTRSAVSDEEDASDSDESSSSEEETDKKRKGKSSKDPLDINRIMAVQEAQPNDAKNQLVTIFKDLFAYTIELREAYQELQRKQKKVNKELEKEEEKRHYAGMEASNALLQLEEVKKSAAESRQKMEADHKRALMCCQDDVRRALLMFFVSFMFNMLLSYAIVKK